MRWRDHTCLFTDSNCDAAILIIASCIMKIRIHKTVIMPFVLYECRTMSLSLRAECRLRVFENRVLRNIFWHKREEVTGH
jgi:hypothetical protein